MRILLYQDYVHNNGALYQSLANLFGTTEVAFCDASDIQQGILTPEITALIMPGGASRYVAAKLDGAGNARIKDYVAQGGRYIGICAGAYYACRRTEWQPAEGPSFLVDNELGFFPGTAKGPIAAFADENGTARIVGLEIGDQSRQVFYWGGPVFHSTEPETFNVLATYRDNQAPAIVSGSFGQGSYLLISPHLEYEARHLELMRFDVVQNRYKDIAAMDIIPSLSAECFQQLLRTYLS